MEWSGDHYGVLDYVLEYVDGCWRIQDVSTAPPDTWNGPCGDPCDPTGNYVGEGELGDVTVTRA